MPNTPIPEPIPGNAPEIAGSPWLLDDHPQSTPDPAA